MNSDEHADGGHRRPFANAMITITFALVFNIWARGRPGIEMAVADQVSVLLIFAGFLLFLSPEIGEAIYVIRRESDG